MRSATEVNWGIVGFGQIARDRVASALRHLRGARLAAVCDPSPEARERARAAYACATYESVDELLADRD